MAELRDYEQWHQAYNDPASSLSWRLRTVQRFLGQALDHDSGPARVLSACAGDGRDLLEVLAHREDADRVRATLVELHPDIAERAREHAGTTAAQVEVRTADAGLSDTYLGAVPAELVLLIGIFGNISDVDLQTTIAAAPQLGRHRPQRMGFRADQPLRHTARVIQAVPARQVATVVCQHLLDELATVLARPRFRRWITLADAAASVEALRIEADLRPNPVAVPQRVRDPDYLVALADAAEAVIVTGDTDLLEADLTPPAVKPHGLIDRLGRT